MPINLKPTDVVIVGLGAAGGVAALPLAEAGLNVIGLEAGPWLTTQDFAPDELRYRTYGWPQSKIKANHEIPTMRPNANVPARRARSHPMMNAVGGTSIHYTAASWRVGPWEFRIVSETTKRYGASRIPKDSTIEDWPLTYDELEPYYDAVEYALGVSGKAGNLQGKVVPGGNPFEGPRAREFPMPPLRQSEYHQRMAAAAKRLGWNPFPLPAAINSQFHDGRSACMYHGFCTNGGCPVGAKNSTAVTTIPRALKTGRFTVVPLARVIKIEVDNRERVTGVTYLLGSETYFQPAAVVLLAAHTYENTRLLLLSTSQAFPNGLSNRHGQVGKHYFSHALWPVVGLYPFRVSAWYGSLAQGAAIDDWADDHFDHSGLHFIGGGNFQIGGNETLPIAAASMPLFGKAPRWGSAWKAFIKQNAGRYAQIITNDNVLPYEGNYLDLDPTEKDALGFPVIRITGTQRENENKAGAFLQDKMVQLHREAGAIETSRGDSSGMLTPGAHVYGGTRMGNNPETNVVDRWGFSHEVPNLGILGGSVMGSAGSKNPTLTLQALAWRTADYLVKSWKSIAG